MTYIRPESVQDLKECKRLGRERRERIRDEILNLLTGPTFHSEELAHFRFVSSMFHLPDRVEALTDASGPDARLELMVALMLTVCEMALDNKPVQSARSIEKDMMARYESVARKPAAAGAPAPVKPTKPPSIYNQRRSKLSPEELERVRKLTRERQTRYRAKLKAEKSQIG